MVELLDPASLVAEPTGDEVVLRSNGTEVGRIHGRRDVLQVRIESELAQDRGGMLPPVLGGALIGHGRQAAGVLDCESSQAFTAEAR